MVRLHDSEIVSHGNLRPSNCLVDSRWVLQIADYALHSLRSIECHAGNDDDDYLLYHSQSSSQHVLRPVHTGNHVADNGDYSLRKRQQCVAVSGNYVAVFGDFVASVDRP